MFYCVCYQFLTPVIGAVYTTAHPKEAALGPRAVAAELPVFVGWISRVLVRFMAREEKITPRSWRELTARHVYS